jgi:hypothetical protein
VRTDYRQMDWVIMIQPFVIIQMIP